MKRDESSQGFEDWKLNKCPVCGHQFWKDIIAEHIYVVHSMSMNEAIINWKDGRKI